MSVLNGPIKISLNFRKFRGQKSVKDELRHRGCRGRGWVERQSHASAYALFRSCFFRELGAGPSQLTQRKPEKRKKEKNSSKNYEKGSAGRS